jgi:hypothetical protein
MKKEDIHPAMQACVGAHEALRRLGFQSCDIFGAAMRGIAFVILRTQGKEFVYGAAKYDGTEEEFAAMWEKTATAICNEEVSAEDFASIYFGSPILRDKVATAEFMLAILKKGIDIPGRQRGAQFN